MKYLILCFVLACTPPDVIKSSAETNARAYLKDMGVESSRVSCSDSDSDQDYYVTCAVKDEAGKTEAIECNYDAYFRLFTHTGCKTKNVLTVTTP